MHNTSALKNYKNPQEYKVFNMGNKPSPFEQTDGDLREWLLGEKGFSQEEADQMITSGAYTTDSKDFLAWYKKKGETQDLAAERVDAPAAEPPVEEGTPMMHKIPEPFKGNYGQVLHNRDYDSDTSEGKKEHHKRNKH